MTDIQLPPCEDCGGPLVLSEQGQSIWFSHTITIGPDGEMVVHNPHRGLCGPCNVARSNQQQGEANHE